METKINFNNRKEKEIVVVATMSSGKSTLINALLSKKLLPSSNEACTAIITKVINTNQENYSAKAYSEKKELLYEEYDVSYEKMKKWNNNENISEIEIYGNIPFANKKEILNLTLIDTPGPNNSRNSDHQKILEKYLENIDENTIILYVLNATQLGITDDSNLLDNLIKNIGDNSKNIIFVLNKLDCFNDEDDVLETLAIVNEYIEKKGIVNPDIFPLAALPALKIRSEPQSIKQKQKRDYFIDIMNIDENLHLEKYSVMKNEDYKLKNMNDEERALVHTGISELEDKIIYKITEKEKMKEGDKMKEVFIKYNPFTLETEIIVNGKNLNEGSNSSFNKRQRLQEYNLIEKLDSELNYNGDYYIKFHGTGLDYEDIKEYVKEKSKNRNIQLEHIKSREVKDRKKEVENIFYEIQNNSYDLENLKSEDLKDRFEKILNSEFEINVIATMSSGKSTLINSLLSKKILPLSNKACTATITRIKDVDTGCFTGKAYSKENIEIYSEKELNYDIMKNWNNDKNISTIEIEGDIPFVKSNEIALVMTDTPGPNNSNDESHKQILLDMLDSNKYKPLILYVMNGTQLAISDDNDLLNTIISKLKNADKQTRDSFLFVVNKLDAFNEEDNDDNVSETLKEVREYLEKKGVENPNIIPLAALPALDIRSEPQSEKQKKKRDFQVDNMNDDKNLHLEKYISLPPKAKQEIENELKQAIEEGEQEKTALIHTGIPSLEKIIKTYIEKYAIAIKIKDLIDLFKGLVKSELETNKSEKKINEIRNDEKKVLDLKNQIDNINNEILKLEEFNDYNNQVEKRKKETSENLEKEIKKLREILMDKVNECAKEVRKNNPKEIKVEIAQEVYNKILETGKNIESNLKEGLKDIIQKNLVETLESLYSEYIEKLKKLTLFENKVISEDNIMISPFEMIEGNIESFKNFDEFRSEYSKKKKERHKEERKNDRKWWEFWRWHEPPTNTYYEDIEVEYIEIGDFIETYVNQIETNIFNTLELALKHDEEEIEKIELQFKNNKNQLDNILKNKINSISELLETSENIETRRKIYDEKIKWLESIKKRIEEVIEI